MACFEVIAEDQNWSDKQKLRVLLPKLQGSAGKFVFETLEKKTRSNFQLLVAELNSRFHKVETKKSYRSQ